MSVSKYRKHLRSTKPKYLLTDDNGEVVVSSSDHEEYMEIRNEYLEANTPKIQTEDEP